MILLSDSVYSKIQDNPTITTLTKFHKEITDKIVPGLTKMFTTEEQKVLDQGESIKKWATIKKRIFRSTSSLFSKRGSILCRR